MILELIHKAYYSVKVLVPKLYVLNPPVGWKTIFAGSPPAVTLAEESFRFVGNLYRNYYCHKSLFCYIFMFSFRASEIY